MINPPEQILLSDAWPIVKRIATLCEVMHQYNDILDTEGFLFASEQMLDEARALAAMVKKLKAAMPEEFPEVRR